MNSKIQITRVHQLSSLLLSLTSYGGDVSVPLDHHDKGTSRVVWVSLSNQRWHFVLEGKHSLDRKDRLYYVLFPLVCEARSL